MPVIPSKEDAAKIFGDGGSASREGGTSEQDGGDKAKASAQDLMSKGPVQTDELPPKAGKEELKTRMEELNK